MHIETPRPVSHRVMTNGRVGVGRRSPADAAADTVSAKLCIGREGGYWTMDDSRWPMVDSCWKMGRFEEGREGGGQWVGT